MTVKCYVIMTACPGQESRTYVVCIDFSRKKAIIDKGIDTAIEIKLDRMPDRETMTKILWDVSLGKIGKLVEGEVIEVEC